MQIDREQKADQTLSPPTKAVASNSEPDTASPDETTVRANRRQNISLAPIKNKISRMRSRSRHSTVTDRGQTNASQEELQKLSREFSRVAPPSSGLAEATVIAPERTGSGLPTPLNEPAQMPGVPGVIVSDEPTSPPTLVPETNGTSTRPSKGGIAYPFSLKVDGQGHRANASTVTLQSVDIMTTPAVEESKQLGDTLPTPSVGTDPILPRTGRFSTDAPGAGLFSGQWVPQTPAAAQVEMPVSERPGVERFETAHEDLSTIKTTNSKS